jgi:hypothetical protein
MRVLVCGDREWTDVALVEEVLVIVGATLVIEGGASGADECARYVAEGVTGQPSRRIDADWKRFGKPAGPLRNQKMLHEHPDIGLAFHDHIERSKGTKDMLDRLRRARVPHLLITHHEDYRPTLKAVLRSISEPSKITKPSLFGK